MGSYFFFFFFFFFFLRLCCGCASLTKVGGLLTDFENHKTLEEHNSALFSKLTVFYFVNNYMTLFYIAFAKSSIEGCTNPFTESTTCGLELTIQVP